MSHSPFGGPAGLGATLNVCSDIFGVRLKFWEWLALASVGALANYLPFSGALLVRGGYLRQRYQLPLTQFAGAMAGMLLIAFFTSGLMGAMVLGWSYVHHRLLSLPLLAVFAAMSLGAGSLMFFSCLPGGLGVREGVIGLTSQLLGQSWSQGLILASLDRLISMLWIFLLAGVFTPVLSAQMQRPT